MICRLYVGDWKLTLFEELLFRNSGKYENMLVDFVDKFADD